VLAFPQEASGGQAAGLVQETSGNVWILEYKEKSKCGSEEAR
jgi:hypothetical protein